MKYSLFMLRLRIFYFFFVLYPYFAIVRSTRFPRSALRCLPSSLFVAELITNDKFVEISPLTCLVFVEAVSVPITWWNDNYWRPKTFGRYDICTTSDLWNGNHSTRSELDFSSIPIFRLSFFIVLGPRIGLSSTKQIVCLSFKLYISLCLRFSWRFIAYLRNLGEIQQRSRAFDKPNIYIQTYNTFNFIIFRFLS